VEPHRLFSFHRLAVSRLLLGVVTARSILAQVMGPEEQFL